MFQKIKEKEYSQRSKFIFKWQRSVYNKKERKMDKNRGLFLKEKEEPNNNNKIPMKEEAITISSITETVKEDDPPRQTQTNKIHDNEKITARNASDHNQNTIGRKREQQRFDRNHGKI